MRPLPQMLMVLLSLAAWAASARGAAPPPTPEPPGWYVDSAAEPADPFSEDNARLKKAEGPPTFAEARANALARGRPLLVWRGYFCGSSQKRLSADFCHWQAPDDDSWSPAAHKIPEDGLTVLVPRGGEMHMVPGVSFVAANDVCVNSVKRAHRETLARLAAPAAGPAFAAQAPAFRPPPAFAPAWGGGGGGAWGGGGGGGG